MGLINRENLNENVVRPVSSVAAILRETRISLGEDIDRVAQHLRIRAIYLRAIEEGRFNDLPGVPYAIGFVRSYAEHLGLNAAEVVERFKDESADGLVSRQELVFPSPLSEGRVPGVRLTLLALVLAGAAYGAWYYLSSGAPSIVELVEPVPEKAAVEAPPAPPPSVPEEPEVPAALPEDPAPAAGAPEGGAAREAGPEVGVAAPAKPILNPPPTVTPSDSAGDGTERADGLPAVPMDLPADGPGGGAGRIYGQANLDSRVALEAVAETWVQVRDSDGELLLTRLLRQGDVYRVPNRPGLTMMTGSAGGLRILVDGREAPRLGNVGVVRRDVSLDPERLLAGR